MRFSILALALAAVISTGCKKDAAATGDGECAVAEDCADGLQCIDSTCREVQCTTSLECPFDSYCDVQNYTCLDGCKEDTDCLSGYACDSVANTCVEDGCRDTQLDCEYGELCDTTSEECVQDSRAHCDRCDVMSSSTNQCPGGECYFWIGDSCNNNSDCDAGFECENIPGYGKICHADHCLVTCNPNLDTPCPRGFDCLDASGLGDYVCHADCNYMTVNGYL